MSHIKHAVICAAGIGSRLNCPIPKCLVEVCSKKIIDYQLELLQDIPNIRIVVGFQHDMIINHVKHHKNVTCIINENYKTTSSAYSAYLATKDLSNGWLLLAGDLLIEKTSFFNFLKKCKSQESLIGITHAKTTFPMYVERDKKNNVIRFKKNKKSDFEWPCIAFSRTIKMNKNSQNIFESFFPHFPLPSHVITCYEIDTTKDLTLATHHFEKITYKEQHDYRISTSQPT